MGRSGAPSTPQGNKKKLVFDGLWICSSECVCVPLGITGNPWVWSRGLGQIHRCLVNEAGDVSEDMEMGRHFHVPAPLLRKTRGNGFSSSLLYRFAGRPPNLVTRIFNPNFGL